MLQELEALKKSIVEERVTDALTLIEELDGMSRKSVIRTIKSYLVRLLVHLLKNQVEQRLTNSWVASIRGSIFEIQDLNLQDNKSSYYLKPDEWDEYLEAAFQTALYEAASEIFGGKFTAKEIAAKVEEEKVKEIALKMIRASYNSSPKTLAARLDDTLSQLPGGDIWKKD